MILIIPNIVQNLYLHLSMPFIVGLHPPYPTSPTYPKPCYPTSPTPTPGRTLPPPLPRPPPPLNCFFEFSQKHFFSVHIHPDPPTRPPPPLTRLPPRPDPTPPPPPPKKKKIFFFLNIHKSFNSPFPSTLNPPTRSPP